MVAPITKHVFYMNEDVERQKKDDAAKKEMPQTLGVSNYTKTVLDRGTYIVIDGISKAALPLSKGKPIEYGFTATQMKDPTTKLRNKTPSGYDLVDFARFRLGTNLWPSSMPRNIDRGPEGFIFHPVISEDGIQPPKPVPFIIGDHEIVNSRLIPFAKADTDIKALEMARKHVNDELVPFDDFKRTKVLNATIKTSLKSHLKELKSKLQRLTGQKAYLEALLDDPNCSDQPKKCGCGHIEEHHGKSQLQEDLQEIQAVLPDLLDDSMAFEQYLDNGGSIPCGSIPLCVNKFLSTERGKIEKRIESLQERIAAPKKYDGSFGDWADRNKFHETYGIDKGPNLNAIPTFQVTTLGVRFPDKDETAEKEAASSGKLVSKAAVKRTAPLQPTVTINDNEEGFVFQFAFTPSQAGARTTHIEYGSAKLGSYNILNPEFVQALRPDGEWEDFQFPVIASKELETVEKTGIVSPQLVKKINDASVYILLMNVIAYKPTVRYSANASDNVGLTSRFCLEGSNSTMYMQKDAMLYEEHSLALLRVTPVITEKYSHAQILIADAVTKAANEQLHKMKK